ncbi:MAG: RidA family protein [Candidatus Latescibacteria bacterium]|nr:RidA family protein [Candidatus Latescibacterota bacterium]
MAYTTIEPEHVRPVAAYKMATRYESGRLLFLPVQWAYDADGQLVGGGDIRIQTRQVYENLRLALRDADGDLADLVKITTYLTCMNDFPASKEARDPFIPGDAPAATLLEVPRFQNPDVLIQVEAVAVIDTV